MKLLLTVLLAIALFSVTQGVVISWEESLEGKIDYRFFYLNVPHEQSGQFDKPSFGIVNGLESYEYGALGSLYCPQTGLSVAVYHDWNNDDKNVWRCYGINILPFAAQPTTPSPPICPALSPSGVPALWNQSQGAWECGTYNQILTLATREDITISCGTADFLMFYESVGEIRCVNPQDIDPDMTLQERDVVSIEERVDTRSDKKWFNIMSDMEVTTATAKTWNNWRWTPHLNYDSTSGSAQIPTPPVALPFESTLIAVTFASFRLASYNFYVLTPTANDHFTGVVSKLSSNLAETPITSTLVFDSVSATSGQVTYSLSGNALATANAGEAYVAGITNRKWVTLAGSDRHVVAVTLWIQVTASFTEYWPLP